MKKKTLLLHKNFTCITMRFVREYLQNDFTEEQKGSLNMPATYAHYLFGKKVYKKLSRDVQQIIKENQPAYLLGLHGPDLVFYYRPVGKNRINQIRTRMHRELASEFFEMGREQYQERPSYVLLSYLCGFLCHFMLDSECHPYISRYMEEQELGHLEIETDFDRHLMILDGLNPVTHVCTRHLIRDLDTEEVIAPLFGITPEQVDESILGFRRCIRLFQCPGKKKAAFLRNFFRLIGQKDNLGGLVMTGIPNPKCEESSDFLTERLEHTVLPAVQIIQEYVSVIDSKEPLSQRLNRDFE